MYVLSTNWWHCVRDEGFIHAWDGLHVWGHDLSMITKYPWNASLCHHPLALMTGKGTPRSRYSRVDLTRILCPGRLLRPLLLAILLIL